MSLSLPGKENILIKDKHAIKSLQLGWGKIGGRQQDG